MSKVCLPFSTTNSFVFVLPMSLLTFHAAVGCVPATMVYCLSFTVETLKNKHKIEKKNPTGGSLVISAEKLGPGALSYTCAELGPKF